jgi:regulatory protein
VNNKAEASCFSLLCFKMETLRKKITAIKASRSPRIQRSNIFLDGKFAFSLDNEVIAKEALRVGWDLTNNEVELLTRTDHYQRCLNAAFQFLSFRPRSEKEIRERLQRRGYQSEDVEKSITQLKRLDLVNDNAFAEYWKENRNSFRPRGQRMLKLELRRKGVETEIIREVIGDIKDETDNAYRAAETRARTLPVADYQVFRQRLSGYLQRRGFDYGVINKVIKKAWQERTGDSGVRPVLTEEVNAAD